MELADMSLNTYLEKYKNIEEDVILKILYQILMGIKYLHQMHILHRDLKPDNVLIVGDLHCKIADFGLSKKLDHSKAMAKSVKGTEFYMAPEIRLA